MMDRQLAAFYNMHYQQAINSLKVQSDLIEGLNQTRSSSDQSRGSYSSSSDEKATYINKGFYYEWMNYVILTKNVSFFLVLPV